MLNYCSSNDMSGELPNLIKVKLESPNIVSKMTQEVETSISFTGTTHTQK